MQQFQEDDQVGVRSYNGAEIKDLRDQETDKEVCFKLLWKDGEWSATSRRNQADIEKSRELHVTSIKVRQDDRGWSWVEKKAA